MGPAGAAVRDETATFLVSLTLDSLNIIIWILLKEFRVFPLQESPPTTTNTLKCFLKKVGKATFSQKKFIVQIYTKFSLTGASRVFTKASTFLCKTLVTPLEEAVFYRQWDKTATDVHVIWRALECTCKAFFFLIWRKKDWIGMLK